MLCFYIDLSQKHLAAMAEKASVEDVMRILTTAHTQENKHLWNVCSKLVAKSGPSSEILQKHLPANIVCELEDIRRKSGFGFEAAMSSNTTSEQKTKRMQKALDSSDVELVQLMINGEGLNLDKAFALHYAVSKCSRYASVSQLSFLITLVAFSLLAKVQLFWSPVGMRVDHLKFFFKALLIFVLCL